MLGINCTIKILETILSLLPISRCQRRDNYTSQFTTPNHNKEHKNWSPITGIHLVDWMDMKHQNVSITHTT